MSSPLELIGNTPLLHLDRLSAPGRASLLAKLEYRNPSGSVKDRVVAAILADAEARGLLKPGDTLVEASMGNTAISLAFIGTVKRYGVLLVMPEGIPLERRRILTQLGAQIRLTPREAGMQGAQETAKGLQQQPGHFLLNQFENPITWRVHMETTAREILDATGGKIDAFVAGVGTGGTITGVGTLLKQQVPSALVVAVEPKRSPLLSQGKTGLSQGKTGVHGIPGLGPNFIPAVLKREVIDEVITVSDEDAYHASAHLAQEEGLLVGISSGANIYAAIQIAQRLGEGKTVVTVFPDSGDRHLLWPIEMPGTLR
ncbi:MAG: cysteine synthase A [Chloroflexi bacterium]|nr:cysteine synthase A [Chloroflexota bacterium]